MTQSFTVWDFQVQITPKGIRLASKSAWAIWCHSYNSNPS